MTLAWRTGGMAAQSQCPSCYQLPRVTFGIAGARKSGKDAGPMVVVGNKTAAYNRWPIYGR